MLITITDISDFATEFNFRFINLSSCGGGNMAPSPKGRQFIRPRVPLRGRGHISTLEIYEEGTKFL